jgi:hypothetical protein
MTDRWLEFDIHGRVAIRVDAVAPTAALLGDMFAPFRTQALERAADITVTGRFRPITGMAHAEDYQYTEEALFLERTGVQIVRDGDVWEVNGTRELLVSVLPLIDRVAVTRGAAMFHAANVSTSDGVGIALPAAGGVGKTSTIAKLVRREGMAFMGDDWAFLSAEKEMLGYEKPMFIKPHHRPIYPHLFKKRKKPLVPVRLSKPLGRMTTLVHPYITRYPRFARASRRWSPEHMMVPPRKAFPGVAFAERARLGIAIFVERHDGSTTVLEPRSERWMLARMMGNFNAELSAGSRDVITCLAGAGLLPLEDAVCEKAEVLRSALSGIPCYLLQVPRALVPDQASDIIVERVKSVLPQAVTA